MLSGDLAEKFKAPAADFVRVSELVRRPRYAWTGSRFFPKSEECPLWVDDDSVMWGGVASREAATRGHNSLFGKVKHELVGVYTNVHPYDTYIKRCLLLLTR